MRKKLLKFEKKMMGVRLYLEDIENVVSIMKNLGGRIVLETREYEFSTLAELVESTRNSLDKLKITSRRKAKEGIVFDFSNEGIVVGFHPEDSLTLRGAAEKIVRVIRKRLLETVFEAVFEIGVFVLLWYVLRSLLVLFLPAKMVDGWFVLLMCA